MISKAKKLYQTARDHTGLTRYFKNTSWLFGGYHFGFLKMMNRCSQVIAEKIKMSESVRKRLINYLRKDILLFAKITRYDLSH